MNLSLALVVLAVCVAGAGAVAGTAAVRLAALRRTIGALQPVLVPTRSRRPR